MEVPKVLPSPWAPQAKKTPGLIFVFLKKKYAFIVRILKVLLKKI